MLPKGSASELARGSANSTFFSSSPGTPYLLDRQGQIPGIKALLLVVKEMKLTIDRLHTPRSDQQGAVIDLVFSFFRKPRHQIEILLIA
jgi:hypothetical protein